MQVCPMLRSLNNHNHKDNTMAGKLITDASYGIRDKKKEQADAKAGKRANAGFVDLTPKAGK